MAGVTQEAIDRIRDGIVSGDWGPGTRLPREADLARELGLSRNSLREAVRALSLARVLEVRQGDGTFVSSLEAVDLLAPTLSATHLLRGRTVLELFEVRRMLEPEAAAMAATRSDATVIAALARELERMHAAGDRAEELVADSERELRRLFAYLEIPFEEQCLRFHENTRVAATLSTQQVRTPLYKSGVAQWLPYEEWLEPLKVALGETLHQHHPRPY